MPPDHATRIAVLQARIDAIRQIVATTHQEDLRDILLNMLEDGERALAQLASQSSLRPGGIAEAVGSTEFTDTPDETIADPGGDQKPEAT